MDDNMFHIEIQKIDTSEARDNLEKLLEENKTYFLHATWGSGKTEFLKSKTKNTNKTLVFLDLWRVKDNRTVANAAYNALNKPIAYFSKFVLIICVMVSILMTDVVNLGIEKKLIEFGFHPKALSIIILIGSLVALFVAVLQLLKVKSDLLYIMLLSKFNRFNGSNKVLVIDDFDRVDEEKQLEAYKVFNLLNKKIPIIFVGDIFKVAKKEDNYLQKIIDRQIELPYILHPQCIWDTYFNMLQKELDFRVDDKLKNLFISEKRNLREQFHFNDYVNLEFFGKAKLDRVQINQQLLIIYLYLFHKECYYNLQSGWFPKYKLFEGAEKRYKVVDNSGKIIQDNVKFDNSIEETIDYILGKNNNYPTDFFSFKQIYYIFEGASNLSLKEIDLIIENEIELKNAIESNQKYSSDFYRYVSALFNTEKDILDNQHRTKIIEMSFELLKANKTSSIINLVTERIYSNHLFKRQEEGIYFDTAQEEANMTIDFFNSTFLSDFDVSQKMHFFTDVLNKLEYKYIFEFFESDIKEALGDKNKYLEEKRQPYILITQVLSSVNRVWIPIHEWNNETKIRINRLSEQDFILFWTMFRIIRVKYINYETNSFNDIKSIVIIHGSYGQKKFREEDKSYEHIVELFENRIKSIGQSRNWLIYDVVDEESQQKYLY